MLLEPGVRVLLLVALKGMSASFKGKEGEREKEGGGGGGGMRDVETSKQIREIV